MNATVLAQTKAFARAHARSLIAGALVIATIAALWLALSSPAKTIPPTATVSGTPAPQVGHVAPEFSLTGLENKPITLASMHGKVVILNFWYIACTGCRIELPALEHAYQAHAKDGLVILGANDVDSLDDMRSFTKSIGLTYPVGEDHAHATNLTYNITKTPSSYIIDRQGVIRYFSAGPLDPQTIDAVTGPLLAAK